MKSLSTSAAVTAGAGLAALGGFGTIVGTGIAHDWPVANWGPLSAWVSSALTLGAITVSLGSMFRVQQARLVDHELNRRKAFADALIDLWGSIAEVSLDGTAYFNYLEDLPKEFDPNKVRPATPWEPAGEVPLAEEIATKTMEFLTEWMEKIEPHMFAALLRAPKNTELNDLLNLLNRRIRAMVPLLQKLSQSAVAKGTRPDVAEAHTQWSKIIGSRQQFLDAGRKYMNVGLDDLTIEVRK